MSKKSKFIECVEDGFFSKVNMNDLDPDVVAYWEALKGTEETDKPMFTDNGKLVMSYLQSTEVGGPALKARDIAEALFVSSRTVSGAMRKLVTDGFVEKIGDSPVMYSITDKGRNIEIN